MKAMMSICIGAVAFVSTHAIAAESFVVVERATNEVTLHRGKAGDALGDLIVFANPVFDIRNVAQIGTDHGHCVRVAVGKSLDCFWTLILKEGQIMSEGPVADAGDSTLAISGGTGKYAGARGVLIVHPRADKETAYDFRYELL
jgi:hypothetical protein